MLNRAAAMAICSLFVATLFGQSPASSPVPAKKLANKATTVASMPTATPTPGQKEVINSLGDNDLQTALSLLKNNFANGEALPEPELNRATLTGLFARMPGGLLVLPNKESTPAEQIAPFYREVFENHIGYARLGFLNGANLKELDKALQEFGAKKIDAVIVDLREKGGSGDFATAAEFAKRFCAKGKTLFNLRKQGTKQDRSFASDRDPAFQGLIAVLTDGDTAGGAEALAAALRAGNKALIIGEVTAGRAVEYSDLPLPSGKILRVASAEAVLPDGQPLFPGGVKPDLPVELSVQAKREIFRASAEKGMSTFVYETDRPHFNEAALIPVT